MDDLITQLRNIGFPEDYLQAIREQRFSEVKPIEVKGVEFITYDCQVDYTTDITYSDE